MDKTVYCATKAVVLNKDGKMLAIKQSIGGKEYLDLPGGRMEYGLSPEENIIKEVKEEIFLDVKVEKILGTYHFFREIDNMQVVCMTYLCTPKSKKIDMGKNPDDSERISWHGWVTPEEFLNLKSAHFDGLDRLKNLVKSHFNL